MRNGGIRQDRNFVERQDNGKGGEAVWRGEGCVNRWVGGQVNGPR